MRALPVIAALLIATNAFAGTRDNDDTCDIRVAPAATLLLPYFEIDLQTPGGQTTLFTITNVTRYSQIAHVTIWTDFAFPVLDFNIFLTGYDLQSINLKDILTTGTVAPPTGTGPTTAKSPLGTAGSTPSLTSPANGGPGFTNPNFKAAINCDSLPGVIPQSILAAIRTALTAGTYPGCAAVGRVHAHAIGYATIDVVGTCTSRSPSDPLYYTNDILFDNVLIGDYQHLGSHPAGSTTGAFDAGANPMVHIRAVPEGGAAGSYVPTTLPYTFYDRYTPATSRANDRRQPLPSTFAARYIQGGAGAFATNFTIWREGFGTGSTCTLLPANGFLTIAELVRFDERENPFVREQVGGFLGCCPPPTLPATSSTATADSVYPTLMGADVGGWMYLNLNNGGSASYSVTTTIAGAPGATNLPGPLAPPRSTTTYGPRPSQNWVTITMFGHFPLNRLSGEFDAASLGNGCSPAAFLTTADSGTGTIGPAGGVFVCPPGPTLTNGTTTLCTGTNVNPKP